MRHILSVLVKNNSGVLSHVASLFTRRGYNIESLSVAETHHKDQSIITLVVDEEDRMIRQIERQLYKLVDVIKIEDLSAKGSMERELVLVSIKSDKESRGEIFNLINVFQGKISDMTDSTIMVELVATPRQIRMFTKAISEYGIIRMARSGTVALPFLDEE